MISPLIMIKV